MTPDVSILIVHYNTPGLLRQTLKGIRESAIGIPHEVLVVDNNPHARISSDVAHAHPEARVIETTENLGFGVGMNCAMKEASGRYLFVFNPDVCLFPGAIEALVAFMDAHPSVGAAGPKLLNPDGSVQTSRFRFLDPLIIAYRRLPLLRNLPFAKRAVDRYLMADVPHEETQDVDYLLGAAILARRSAVEQVGYFDPRFFMYFEDQDWCRRFWKAGWRVVYHPPVALVHYHRRETAEGSFLSQLLNPLTRIQMKSALYYYQKYRGEPLPRSSKLS